MAEQSLRASKSPFAAYLNGRLFSAGASGNPLEPIAGAFQLAQELGDERAGNYQRDFFRQHPTLDASAVMASYSMMKSTASR
jgi:hypothetical protein